VYKRNLIFECKPVKQRQNYILKLKQVYRLGNNNMVLIQLAIIIIPRPIIMCDVADHMILSRFQNNYLHLLERGGFRLAGVT